VAEPGWARDERAVDAWIPMADGVRLAVTLYLPDDGAGPQPCILEALPYRKDDQTASYRPEYSRLRDEFRYAVARVDLRGTGSSGGLATDEYPEQEQVDLLEVIAWLAAQPWCDGNVGMYGTSYSGFNALQLACERPPALKAVVAIYATDDRYTDDVHYTGGLLRWLDLVDYCHYMTPMNALPPVPAVWGAGWREEWLRRIDATEPWLLRWMAEQRDGPYWRRGSVRPDYARIECAVMVVAGWADGYRNNSFRTMAALARAGVPHRLLAGPWSHAATSSSRPGPRIDLVPEMVRWWDRWLRGVDNEVASGVHREPSVTYFLRRSTRPEPDLDTWDGEWRQEDWPSPRVATRGYPLDARPPYDVRPDVGVDAWITCAGHLPYGQPLDQRAEDAACLTWEWPAGGLELLGHPVLSVEVAASAPVATLAARLTDVFPDGTSVLISRGVLNLSHRSSHTTPEPLVPGRSYPVVLELDATAYGLAEGHRLRLAVSGALWPDVVSPPAPLTLTLGAGTLELPVLTAGSPYPAPVLVPGGGAEEIDQRAVWRVERDVLARTTTCRVAHGSTGDVPYGGISTERYDGSVTVDRRTFAQQVRADVSFDLTWPEATVSVRSALDVRADADVFEVRVTLDVEEEGHPVAHREWQRRVTRDLG